MIDLADYPLGVDAPADVFVGPGGGFAEAGSEGAVQIVCKGVTVDQGALTALTAAASASTQEG